MSKVVILLGHQVIYIYIYNSSKSSCEKGSTLSFTNNTLSISSNISDKCYIYFNYVDWIIPNTNAATFVTNYQGYSNVVNQNGYRYSGTYSEVNNWVCFGSTASTCPDNNLYQIIGVFNIDGSYKYKLIQGDYATTTELGTYNGRSSKDGSNPGNTKQSAFNTYYWDSSNVNTWGSGTTCTSSLCTLFNGTYLTNIGSTWSNKIATSTWYVGGYTTSSATASTFYSYESATNGSESTLSAKVGLMYVSDYGYAANSTFWNTNMGSYNSANANNWLYNGGVYEWLLTRNSTYSNYSYCVVNNGYLNSYYANGSSIGSLGAVRPTFYLNSDITIVSGYGTYDTPYRLS